MKRSWQANKREAAIRVKRGEGVFLVFDDVYVRFESKREDDKERKSREERRVQGEVYRDGGGDILVVVKEKEC